MVWALTLGTGVLGGSSRGTGVSVGYAGALAQIRWTTSSPNLGVDPMRTGTSELHIEPVIQDVKHLNQVIYHAQMRRDGRNGVVFLCDIGLHRPDSTSRRRGPRGHDRDRVLRAAAAA
jgi:hypothetical protein